MTEQRKRTVVNSWNEWDPLKHVIVGRTDGTMVQAPEPAIRRDWPKDGFPLGTYGPLPKEIQAKGKELMENFAKILGKRGIRVDRPTPIDFSQTVQTPDWVQKSMSGCMPPRDLLLTVGNEILEATMTYRSRWFEYLCYRPLLERYFKEDPNVKWEAAPKPRLTDKTYKLDFWEKFESLTEEDQIREYTMKKEWVLTEEEPCFDAADISRYGKDLFVQRSSTTNAAGISWIKRHFYNHRVHEVLFRETLPMHIDATFLPLRHGLALSNPRRIALVPGMKELFKKNDWEIIECATPFQKEKAKLSYCSKWLSMNILMLDPKTVCVEAQEIFQMEQFDKLGFEVIPVPFWDVSPFGGGLHCATADVYREGTYQDYFPKQIPGF